MPKSPEKDISYNWADKEMVWAEIEEIHFSEYNFDEDKWERKLD